MKQSNSLTIILECFHFVSLLRTLSRLIQENMFLQQNGDKASPISSVSAVSSGCSPITHEGKSNRAMLKMRVQLVQIIICSNYMILHYLLVL